MEASFVAYIDESGDEGFKFRRRVNEQASSDWFVLAAFVTRRGTGHQVVRSIETVRRELKLHPGTHVHWKKLKHVEKVRYSQIMAALDTTLLAVCVHKPSLLEPETFQERYRLYFYAVRYLLERVSWLARDEQGLARASRTGAIELVFSNRQGMPYEEMRRYLCLLRRQQQAGRDIRIEFDRLPVEKLRTRTPDKCMGLQLADATAGAFFNALERDRFGNTEPRYLQTLFGLLYRHSESVRGYGLKIVPTEAVPRSHTSKGLHWLTQVK